MTGFLFRDENDYASNQQLKRPRGGARRRRYEQRAPASCPQPDVCEACEQIVVSAPDQKSDTAIDVVPMIPVPADLGCALPAPLYTFRTLDVDTMDAPENFLGFLGKGDFAYGPDRPETPFNLAAMAVDLAVQGIQHQSPILVERSEVLYAKALHLTREAIYNVTIEASDQLMVTCLLLSGYEVRSPCCRSRTED